MTNTHMTAPALRSGPRRDYDQRPPLDERWRATWGLRAKHLVQRLIYALLAAIGLFTSLRTSSRPPLRSGDPRIKRILVIRVDLIGDVVLSLPVVQALRQGYPAATLDMLVLPSTAGVLRRARGIDHILIYDPNIWRTPPALLDPGNWRGVRDLVTSLRASRYDLCVSVAGDWASVLAWISGARCRVGYSGEAYPGLMTDPVPGRRYFRHEHEVSYGHRLAQAAGGVITPESARPALHVSPAERRSALDRLANADQPALHAAKPLVVLHAGAQNGSAKRWPATSWADLADRLATHSGVRVAFTGAASDRPLVDAILACTSATHIDLCGKTSLTELVDLLAAADLLISGDSGPLHIACAVGTPVVGLYGPTDPLLSGPVAPDAVVLRHQVWCAPCYDASATAECRFGNPVCMKQLSPSAVWVAANRQLAARRACAMNPATSSRECD